MKLKFFFIAAAFITVLGTGSVLLAATDLQPQKKQGTECSKNSKLCEKLTELEKLYQEIPKQSDFHPNNLVNAAHALAVGYAHLGNIEKAEEYYDSSLGVAKPQGNSHTPKDWESMRLGRILEQYILNGKIDETIQELKENGSNKHACSSVVQLLGYQQNMESLNRVLKETNCSTFQIGNVCRKLSETQIALMFSSIRKTLESQEQNTENITQFDYEIRECLHTMAYIKKDMGKPPLLEELTRTISPADPKNLDLLKERLIRIHVETNSKNYAESLFKTIEDQQIRKSAAKTILSSLAYQNDPAALEYRHLYPELDAGNNGNTEIQFILLIDRQFANQKHKLGELVYFLEKVKDERQKAEKKPLKQLSERCQKLTYHERIFEEIRGIYAALPIEQKAETKNLYLKANAIVGNYKYLKEMQKAEPAETQNWHKRVAENVAKYNADCETYLGEIVTQALEGHGDMSMNNPYMNAISDCIISSGKFRKIFSPDRSAPLTPLQTDVVRMLKNRFIYHPELGLECLDLIETNLPNDLKNQILGTNLMAVRNTQDGEDSQKMSEEVKKHTLAKITAYLADPDNFDPYVMNNFIETYMALDIERVDPPPFDLATMEEKSDSMIKTIRETQENNNLNKRPQTFSDKIAKKTQDLIGEIMDTQPFVPYQQNLVYISTY